MYEILLNIHMKYHAKIMHLSCIHSGIICYLLHIHSSQIDLIEDFLAVNVFHLMTAPVADS